MGIAVLTKGPLGGVIPLIAFAGYKFLAAPRRTVPPTFLQLWAYFTGCCSLLVFAQLDLLEQSSFRLHLVPVEPLQPSVGRP